MHPNLLVFKDVWLCIQGSLEHSPAGKPVPQVLCLERRGLGLNHWNDGRWAAQSSYPGYHTNHAIPAMLDGKEQSCVQGGGGVGKERTGEAH